MKSVIAKSNDGITWEIANSPSKERLNSICYGKGRFIAVGDSGTIIVSPDGLIWNKSTADTKQKLVSVSSGKNYFVALGSRESYAGDSIFISQNGIDWIKRKAPQDKLYSIGYGDNKFIAVGYNGLILTSNEDLPVIVRSVYKHEMSIKNATFTTAGKVTISLPDMAVRSSVVVNLFTISGRKIRTLKLLPLGDSIRFPAGCLTSGLYWYILTDKLNRTLAQGYFQL